MEKSKPITGASLEETYMNQNQPQDKITNRNAPQLNNQPNKSDTRIK